MNPSFDWRSSLLLALPVVLTACGPTSPADGTGAADGTTGTSTTTEGTSSTTEQADSSGSTGMETSFACPDARWHEGDLEIDDTTEIDALRDVGGVTGSLRITGTSSIVDLEFLSCLEVVEGTVWIHENESLAELRGLERLHTINPSLREEMGPYHWDLGVSSNPALMRIGSLDSLETIGTLRVQSNATLTEIEMSSLRHVETLWLGGFCVDDPVPDQPLTHVGSYPVLEHVESFALYAQYDFTSLDSLVELAERGVVFDDADFGRNPFLAQTEIDAFAAAASLFPYTCSNMDDREQCRPCPTD